MCGHERMRPRRDPSLDFGGFWKMLQFRGHVQDVGEVLLQDHDQVMEQRDVPAGERQLVAKGTRVSRKPG